MDCSSSRPSLKWLGGRQAQRCGALAHRFAQALPATAPELGQPMVAGLRPVLREVIAQRDAGSNSVWSFCARPTADAAGVGSAGRQSPWVRQHSSGWSGCLLPIAPETACFSCSVPGSLLPACLLAEQAPAASRARQARGAPSRLRPAPLRSTTQPCWRTCAAGGKGAPRVKSTHKACGTEIPWYEPNPAIWSGPAAADYAGLKTA